MSASISKIHVTNSTGLSLNDRFTAVQDRRRDIPEPRVLRPAARRDTSVANRRLLQQLARRHKLQAALKLKRRSMRPIGGNIAMRRGTIKALRVAANGKPIRTNSLTTVATMEADLITNSQRTTNRPQRRGNSVSNRLGSRRPMVGGAAQRIAQRRLQHRPMQGTGMMNEMQRRGRSRSRSRAPVAIINLTRSRSRSTGRGGVPMHSQLRGRSRSRQRSRSRVHAGARAHLPIKARLGLRPGAITRPRLNANGIRGVAQGRIQRRRNSNLAAGVGGRAGRPRGRSMARNANANANPNVRSRSRTRNGLQARAQSRARSRTRGGTVSGQRNGGSAQGGRMRGRSQQRRGGRGTPAQRNGNANGNKNGQQQQQQRRGRSRSRGGRGGRNQGKTAKPGVDKDKLDKELDQYMATTRTDNNDFLLRN